MYKITVNMTEKALYDFLLYHAYSKASGFLVNVLGMAIAIMGLISYFMGNIGFETFACSFFAAVFFLAVVPVQLYLRAKKQIRINPEYNQPVEYTFADDGIMVQTGERTREFAWEQMEKTVLTPKTVGIYYGKDEALILPKWDFGEYFSPIFQMSMYYTERNRMKREGKKEDADRG